MRELNDGIIGVTGCGRTGTSMVMQTLMHLGIPMSAPAFIQENEHIKEFNPNGFYEMNLRGGLYDDRFRGMAVKLFGEQLYRTSKVRFSRLICITRDRDAAIASLERMRQKFLVDVDITSEQIYDANESRIHSYTFNDVTVMNVQYEQVCSNPEKFVTDLILYLQITPTAEQREKAIQNIKKL